MKFSFVYFIVLLFNLALFTSCKQAVPEKDFQRIRNDIFWDTQDGEPSSVKAAVFSSSWTRKRALESIIGMVPGTMRLPYIAMIHP